MGSFVNLNLNPKHRRVGDCVVRALSKALDQSWDKTYCGLCLQGFIDKDMPDGNEVFGHYLERKGFTRSRIPESYAADYDVDDFARENPRGTFILAIDGHVVCVQDGEIFDSWFSGEEHPAFVWYKK